MALLDRGASGIFHVGGPRIVARTEFARMIVAAFELPASLLRPVPTSALGLLAPRPHRAGLSDAKLRRTLGDGLLDPAEALTEMKTAEPH